MYKFLLVAILVCVNAHASNQAILWSSNLDWAFIASAFTSSAQKPLMMRLPLICIMALLFKENDSADNNRNPIYKVVVRNPRTGRHRKAL